MREITIKNDLDKACEIIANLLIKVNDSGNLKLNGFNKYELHEDKEIIRFSNNHDRLSEKVFSLTFEKTKDNVNVKFNDYTGEYIDYEFDCPADKDYMVKLYDIAREFAVDEHIRILNKSVKRVIDAINNK